MLEGSVQTSSWQSQDDKERYYTLSWEATQNQTLNTSTISWTLKADGNYPQWVAEYKLVAVVAGKTVYNNTSRVQRYKGVILSGTTTVTHDSSGNGSFSVSLAASIYSSASNYTGSDTFTLDTIYRLQTVSFNQPFTMGEQTVLTVTKYNDGYRHTLAWSFGDGSAGQGAAQSGSICDLSSQSSEETEVAWIPPLEMARVIPNATAGVGSLVCRTYDGETLIGRKDYTFVVNVPDSIAPTCSLSLNPSPAWHSQVYGYVKGKTSVSAAVTAEGAYDSEIVSYKVTGDGLTYTSQSFVSNVLKTAGEVAFTATVTDSRGRVGTVQQSITVQDYSAPSITSFSTYRCDQDGSSNSNGTYVAFVFSATASQLDECNQIHYSLSLDTSDSTYSNIEVLGMDDPYAVNDFAFVYEVAQGVSCKATLTARDDFSTVMLSSYVKAASKLFSIFKKGLGWAFGKVATLEGYFEVAFKAMFYGTAEFKDEVTVLGAATFDDCVTFNGPLTLIDPLPIEYGGTNAVTAEGAVANLGVADYIVEYGTDDIWTYEKWNSGKAVCWGKKGLGTLSVTAEWGYFYESTESFYLDFPGGLFTDTPDYCQLVYMGGYGSGFIDTGDHAGGNEDSEYHSLCATNTGEFWIGRPKSLATLANVTVGCYAIGKWK